jgi:hypothetical protein
MTTYLTAWLHPPGAPRPTTRSRAHDDEATAQAHAELLRAVGYVHVTVYAVEGVQP